MTLVSPEIKTKLAEWQNEIRNLTGDFTIVLSAYKSPPSKKMFEIIRAISEETGVPESDMKMKTRKREIVVARHLVVYYGRMCTGLSFARLGQLIGGRDHTTAIHANQSIHDLLEIGDSGVCGVIAKINMRLELDNYNGQA